MAETPQDRQPADRGLRGVHNLIESITPWLSEVGSWIFGGLIAVNLWVISSLIAVGPVDRAVLIAITALACALAMNVAGIVLLRLSKDVRDIALDELTLRAFQDAGFNDLEAHFPPPLERESRRKKQSNVTLLYALTIAAVSIALTTIGLIGAFWHMAWWIAVVFVVAVVASIALVAVAFAQTS
jgi:hypothetical protein